MGQRRSQQADEGCDLKNPCRMRRKLPLFAPTGTSTETTRGRKRKVASLTLLAPCKRLASASGGWASLPTDIVGLVTRRLLAVDGDGDVVDHIAFRAVCSGWRACTPVLRDPTLRDPLVRPRGWVALCNGDVVRPDDAREISFFHSRKAMRLRVRLPELRGHRIVGFTDGLVILLHKSTTAVRVLHPFTRVAVDLPPIARAYHESFRYKRPLLEMNAAVCSSSSSATSIAVVVWFPFESVVLAGEPGSGWEILHRELRIWSALPIQGRLYATISCSTEVVQVYPPRQQRPPPLVDDPLVVARVPDIFGDRTFCQFLLVESGGRMLLAVRYPPGFGSKTEWSRRLGFRLYEVTLNTSSRFGHDLIPVSSLGDSVLFLSRDRCLSVSAMDIPSLSSNSIYFSQLDIPIVVYSLRTGLCEELGASCQIHDMKDRIRPSVRPFTIVDHLLTYCNPREWSQGLMFHEYYRIPESFEELKKKIKASNSQLRIPRIAGR